MWQRRWKISFMCEKKPPRNIEAFKMNLKLGLKDMIN